MKTFKNVLLGMGVLIIFLLILIVVLLILKFGSKIHAVFCKRSPKKEISEKFRENFEKPGIRKQNVLVMEDNIKQYTNRYDVILLKNYDYQSDMSMEDITESVSNIRRSSGGNARRSYQNQPKPPQYHKYIDL